MVTARKTAKKKSVKKSAKRSSTSKTKVKYPDIGLELFDGSDLLTEERAKELLGWSEGTKDAPLEKGARVYRINGRNVTFLNNLTNRPLRVSVAKRYADEMLRGLWKLNGESMVIDRFGHCQDCQHRLCALVLANELQRANPEKWGDDPIEIPVIIVTGVDPSPEVIDTVNTGQSRTQSDVFFRNNKMADLTPQPKACNVLKGCVRLAWSRIGGKTVSSAPRLGNLEAVDFLGKHPEIEESVRYVWGLEGGGGDAGRNITTYVQLPYAAALHYLMCVLNSDPSAYLEDRRVQFENAHANEFWHLFVTSQEEPFATLRKLLIGQSKAGSAERDYVVSLIINAFNAWYEKEDMTDSRKAARKLKPKMMKDDRGRQSIAEYPLLGGLDIDWDSFLEEEEAEYDEEYEEE